MDTNKRMKRSGKRKRSLSPDTENLITRRVKALMDQQGWNVPDLERAAKINNSSLYKIINKSEPGRTWTLDQLEKIAPALGVNLWELFEESLHPPIVAEISMSQGPNIEDIIHPKIIGQHDYPFKEDRTTLSQMYCLRVKDRTMLPVFRPGTILTAQRGTWEGIVNEDFVLYCNEHGQTFIRQIFINQDHIILRSFTQGIPDIVLPKRLISSCDKVLRIDFPPTA